MSATPAIQPREQVLADLQDALRRLADALPHLYEQPIRPDRPKDEELLTVGRAAELLSVSEATVAAIGKKHPSMRRRIGRCVRYERGELLRVTKRG